MTEIVLILNDIRSAHNVGSLFRTADAAGVSHVFLAGYTPTPVDRFGRAVKEIHKTALGAEKALSWESGEVHSIMSHVRNKGYTVVALEQDDRSVHIHEYTPPKKVALLVGNEVLGVPKELLDDADAIIEIPMHGMKESLNVSVATGIALFFVQLRS